MNTTLRSLPAVATSSARVLVLGSMPGMQSLRHQQYYANPQNSFWWIMSQIVGFELELDYSHRLSELNAHGVALWDVLRECQREGSLDSAIKRNGEKLNNFDEFLASHSSIELICFNGQAARDIFMRHLPMFEQSHSQIRLQYLPSTSPAYAAMSKQVKLDMWRAAICSIIR